MISERLLRVNEAADILKVSPMQVLKWCDSGHLPCIKIGGSRRIKEADLEFISSEERGPQKLKAEPKRPVYVGPPADECGFDSAADEEERRRQFKKEWEAAQVQIAAIKAKRASTAKAPEPVARGFGSQSTIGSYPSGFDVK